MKRTVVSALHLDNGTLVCKGKSGRMYSVFKKQGDLDGACAIYSVIMNLLILGTINGSDTELDATHNNPDTKRLFHEFCEKYGLHRDGHYFDEIERMLRKSFGKVVKPMPFETINKASVDIISQTILKDNIPVVMQVTGHAMLAVGIEQEDDVTTKILCLDPSGDYMNHTNKRWNAEIQIIRDGRTTYRYRSKIEGKWAEFNTRLWDVLVIRKK